MPLEFLEDIAWELWLLIELLAPVRRRLPNTASQKLVDYVKDRLIAKSVALVKWKKARPELFPYSPIGARDVLPGENWIFPDHRTLAEVIEAERRPARVLRRLPDPLLGSTFTRREPDLLVWSRRRLEAARVRLNLELSERPLPRPVSHAPRGSSPSRFETTDRV